jgi:hypothetical protein
VAPSIPGPQCALRAAIEEPNATPGADAINFDVPGDGGVATIFPSTDLPPITGQVTIDGYSQPGASPNTLEEGTNAVLKIQLDGLDLVGSNSRGLSFLGHSGSRVRGLAINFFSTGVFVDRTATGLALEGNFIGVDPSGTKDFGNESDGVFVSGSTVNVGGRLPDSRNLISGNDGSGIVIDNTASRTGVSENLIGTDNSGTKNLGNTRQGVEISGSNNFLQSNTIAFNGGHGVKVNVGGRASPDPHGDSILSNSIFSNGGLGINLVSNVEGPVGGSEVEGNDAGDVDSGPNGLQNFPVLTSAKTSKKGTSIAGKLNSEANKTFTVQFFASPEADSSGNGEGKTFLGEQAVNTDSSGNATFTFKPTQKVPRGQFITATATTDREGNTSEFSKAKKVVRKR